MPNVLMSGTAEKAAGDGIRIPCDFGNEPRLVQGASLDGNGNLVMSVNIVSFNVTGTGLTVAGLQLDYPYQLSARISGGTAGITYDLVYSITLNDVDATVISRTGPLRVL
jgi:hypothetical protein